MIVGKGRERRGLNMRKIVREKKDGTVIVENPRFRIIPHPTETGCFMLQERIFLGSWKWIYVDRLSNKIKGTHVRYDLYSSISEAESAVKKYIKKQLIHERHKKTSPIYISENEVREELKDVLPKNT